MTNNELIDVLKNKKDEEFIKIRKLSLHVLVWRKKWIEMNSIAYFKLKTIVWNI
ncbi:hypothetical protein [Spiroplasma endosymbiont of Zeiraphera isertana]|uniref:hypothetical protein n=1 Tax=Spiroplasma endosymbiont of Zeiraphera isertana TaxID=3066313 RepID=UPI00313BF0F2